MHYGGAKGQQWPLMGVRPRPINPVSTNKTLESTVWAGLNAFASEIPARRATVSVLQVGHIKCSWRALDRDILIHYVMHDVSAAADWRVGLQDAQM